MAEDFISADLSAVAKFLGAGYALAESPQDTTYVDDLIRGAFHSADNEFNVEAIAMGETGYIKHMFEWGTIGINRGRSSVRPQPSAERARLWDTVMEGTGFNRAVTFVFKPSVGTVPRPTVADTGMDSATIQLLRPHVFWNKAEVFETGESVTIKPVAATWLLMPFYRGNVPVDATDSERARGYRLSKGPNTLVPGQHVAGNFTSFFTRFWTERGVAAMDTNVMKAFETDFILPMELATPDGVYSNMPSTFRAIIKKAQARTRANARARARRARIKAQRMMEDGQ